MCYDCLQAALKTQENMVERLLVDALVIEEKLPTPKEGMVTLEDSDEEALTDSSSDSDLEVELSSSSSLEDGKKSLGL